MLIEDLSALLGPLNPAGGVWYGANTAQPPVYPYIVFQRVVSTANVSMNGPSDVQNTRVQIDIYALRISEAAALDSALDAAFAGAALVNVPISSQDFYEDMVKAFRISRDFSVWSKG